MLQLVGRLGPVNRFNHSSWVVVVTPTDRPKSVCNRCLIETFGGVFVFSRCFLEFSVGVGAFVIGLTQICFFSLQHGPERMYYRMVVEFDVKLY